MIVIDRINNLISENIGKPFTEHHAPQLTLKHTKISVFIGRVKNYTKIKCGLPILLTSP